MTPSRKMLFTGLFIALTTLGGMVRIPFFPVPMTLQTVFVYLSGTLLGGRQGAVCQGLFLMLGLAGLPLFTTGGGLRTAVQPTFGYLLGFPVAAGLSGRLVRRSGAEDRAGRIAAALIPAALVLFALGLGYLAVYTRFIVGRPFDPMHLLWTGFILFLPAETVKLFLTGVLTEKLRPLIKGTDRPVEH